MAIMKIWIPGIRRQSGFIRTKADAYLDKAEALNREKKYRDCVKYINDTILADSKIKRVFLWTVSIIFWEIPTLSLKSMKTHPMHMNRPSALIPKMEVITVIMPLQELTVETQTRQKNF